MKRNKDDTLSLEGFLNGAQKTIKNAHSLHQEALILKDQGRKERSLFLHQISLEECAKFEKICHAAIRLYSGKTCDIKEFEKSIRNHESKNKTNAYFLPLSNEEERALETGDPSLGFSAFKRIQREHHMNSNNKKNSSLYVNFTNGIFSSPDDSITLTDLSEISIQNKKSLEHADRGLLFLEKIVKSPETCSNLLSNINNSLKNTNKADTSAYQQIINEILKQ